MANVSLSFSTIEEYVEKSPYFGCITGDMLTELQLENLHWKEKNTLATNNGPNHLHGGDKGFDKFVWEAELLRLGPGWSLLELVRMGKRGIRGFEV